MRTLICLTTITLVGAITLTGCPTSTGLGGFPSPTYTGARRAFVAGFESVAEFDRFYIVSADEALGYGAEHALVPSDGAVIPVEGASMHVARVLQANDTDNESRNGYRPHRAYPTVQFHKTEDGIYRTPVLISLYVYLDMALEEFPSGSVDDWFSFVTVTPDDSDLWRRTVLANLGPDRLLRLVHVPNQGQQGYLYQNTGLQFPQREWVRVDMFIDFDRDAGSARLWQNGTLVSSALVAGGNGALAQAHFGLYASAHVGAGVVYNDHLRIVEVADETEARDLVAASY